MAPSILDRALGWATSKGLFEGSGGGSSYTFTGSANSRRRGTSELLASYANSPQLRRVTSKIAFSVAATPWRLWRVNGNGGKAVSHKALQRATSVNRRKLMDGLADSGALQEVVDHPLLDLMDKPNPMMSGLTARKLTQLYLDIPGEVFWVIERNALGVPSGYWVIPPHWVSKIPADDEPMFELSISGQRKNVPREDVVWMRDINLVDPMGRGTGTGQALADEIESDEYASKFIKGWFTNRAKPELLIGVEGAKKEQLQEAKERFERDNRGFWQGHKTFWHGGKLVVKELTQSFADMQLMEFRKAQRNITNETYGVPPEVMGIVENSNRATIDSAMFVFATTVLVPRLEFLRNELQNQMVPLYDDRLVLTYDSPVPEDRAFELQAMTAAPYTVTQAEWRRASGLSDRGEQDDIQYIPFGLSAEPSPRKAVKSKTVKGQLTLPCVAKNFTEADIDPLLEKFRPDKLVEAAEPVHAHEYEAWARRTYAEGGYEGAFNILNPRIKKHLAEFAGDRMVGFVHESTKKDLRVCSKTKKNTRPNVSRGPKACARRTTLPTRSIPKAVWSNSNSGSQH